MSPDLLQLARELLAELPWSIVLPAGCGKTELIAALAANVDPHNKPLLILTHTNAGVDVVRKRFTKYGVNSNQARVFTLDTWAKLFDDHFPLLGKAANISGEADLWSGVRQRAKAILGSSHIGDILDATYSAVIVDEYQDCSEIQHDLVVAMSKYLPVGVLGDPLQGIFDFGTGVVEWEKVESSFNPKELTPIPHRWINKNPALGEWLLEIRPSLVAGARIDLTAPGTPIIWRQATVNLSDERIYCFTAVNTLGDQKKVVALRQLPEQCHQFARGLAGRFEVAEEIECKVVRKLMAAIDGGNGGKMAAATLKFLRDCCSGYPSTLNPDLVKEYEKGRIKTYTTRTSPVNIAMYDALNKIVSEPTPKNVKKALRILHAATTRVFRKEAWNVAMKTLEELTYSSDSAVKALLDVRSRNRYGGQYVNKRSISRTLLVKGQEYDECIILGADGMSARNLYVALSRGIDKVTVFSNAPVLVIDTY